jgi:hypothetical protein
MSQYVSRNSVACAATWPSLAAAKKQLWRTTSGSSSATHKNHRKRVHYVPPHPATASQRATSREGMHLIYRPFGPSWKLHQLCSVGRTLVLCTSHPLPSSPAIDYQATATPSLPVKAARSWCRLRHLSAGEEPWPWKRTVATYTRSVTSSSCMLLRLQHGGCEVRCKLGAACTTLFMHACAPAAE